MLYKHLKTGGIYEILGEGIIEKTMTPAIIYRNVDDDTVNWIRPHSEFFDGRFEEIVNEIS
jgi:hypothetical protein